MLLSDMDDVKQKLTKEYIQELLDRHDHIGHHAVGRALVKLYDRQTIDERASKEVRHHNNQGFSPYDAGLGTSMALFYKNNGYLTPKQLEMWQKHNSKGISRIGKYWRQILEDSYTKQGIEPPRSKKQIKQENDLLVE